VIHLWGGVRQLRHRAVGSQRFVYEAWNQPGISLLHGDPFSATGVRPSNSMAPKGPQTCLGMIGIARLRDMAKQRGMLGRV
jgi:hypothetical protein